MLNCLQFLLLFLLFCTRFCISETERKKWCSKINDNENVLFFLRSISSGTSMRFCGIGFDMVNVYTYLKTNKTDDERKKKPAIFFACMILVCNSCLNRWRRFVFFFSLFLNKHLLFGCKHELMKCCCTLFRRVCVCCTKLSKDGLCIPRLIPSLDK